MLTIQEVESIAKEVCLKQNGHAPQIIFCGSHGSVGTIIEDMPDTAEEKAQTVAAAAVELTTQEYAEIGLLHRVFFISEAWMTSIKKSSLGSLFRPAVKPKRVEVLIISEFDDFVQKETTLVFKVRRNDNNKIVGFEKNMAEGAKSISALLGVAYRAYYFAVLTMNELNKALNKKNLPVN